jgi:hypothetical protein
VLTKAEAAHDVPYIKAVDIEPAATFFVWRILLGDSQSLWQSCQAVSWLIGGQCTITLFLLIGSTLEVLWDAQFADHGLIEFYLQFQVAGLMLTACVA